MSPHPTSQVDLDALTSFLDSMRSYSTYLVQDVAPGRLFYHYTDLGALNGIVSNHDLWLTHARYSNDDDEMAHGFEIAKRTIDGELRSERSKKKKVKKRVDFLTRVLRLIEESTSEEAYVCCFCEEDDLLSQWRSYGTNGVGVSLGFDPMEFIHLTGSDMPVGLMRLWKVFYEEDKQAEIVRASLNFAFLHRKNSVTRMAQDATQAIRFFVPTFKNEDFAEEKERRLIFTPNPACPVKPRYRIARGMLVPYYSIGDLQEHVYSSVHYLPLQSVTIGPSVQKELNRDSVTMLLQQNGYHEINPTVSATPYRG